VWNGNECPVHTKIDQKQLEDVEYFNNLSSIITEMQNEHMKLNPGLLWQRQQSTKIRLFLPEN